MVKLLVVTPFLTGGGAEKMLVEYSRLADELAMDVTLINTSSCNQSDNIEGLYPFKVYCLNKEKVSLSFFLLAKYIVSSKPDIILISHLRVSLLIAIFKVLRVYKGKIIVRSESLIDEAIKNKAIPSYYLLIRRFSYFFSDHIIAQTDRMSKNIANSLANTEKKITVLYNFLSTEFCNQQNKDQLHSHNKALKSFVFVGRLTKGKNIDLILEATAYLKKKGERITVNILGKGPEEHHLKMKAEKLGIEKDINFLGYKNDPRKYVNDSQALLITSYYEGLPNVMLEALWDEVPVIMTRCFGNEDRYIISGETGYICESFDAQEYAELMLLVINNKKKISWEKTASLLLNDKYKAKKFLENFSKDIV